jgi:hypothetical protein
VSTANLANHEATVRDDATLETWNWSWLASGICTEKGDVAIFNICVFRGGGGLVDLQRPEAILIVDWQDAQPQHGIGGRAYVKARARRSGSKTG